VVRPNTNHLDDLLSEGNEIMRLNNYKKILKK